MPNRLQKILYVEDEPDIREITLLALEMLGHFLVVAAPDGQTALEALHSFQPDLLLLDFQLPDMDGPSLLQAIHRLPERGDLPAVLLTAHTLTEPEQTGMERLIGVLTKPYDPELLPDRLRELWQGFF